MSEPVKKEEEVTKSAATTPTKSTTDMKTIDPKESYTLEQVTEHNKKDDIWIILRDKTTNVDKVYDVTKFLDEVIFESNFNASLNQIISYGMEM